MKVAWSDEAKLALTDLEDELAERFSPDRAAEIVEELLRRADLLEDNPEMGRVVPEYEQWQLRELVDRWNRVLYRLRPDHVEVVIIAPTKMQLPELEPDLWRALRLEPDDDE